MKFLKWENLLVPLILLSFLSTGVNFMQPTFWLDARWVILILVGIKVYLIPQRSTVAHVTSIVLIFYVAWCLATTLWSEQPFLSAPKAASMVLVIAVAVRAGRWWYDTHSEAESLGFLWPYAIVALAASLGGATSTYSTMTVLTGDTHGSNFLGVATATAMPLTLWVITSATGRRRVVAAGVLAWQSWVLYQTISRGGYLIALGAATGWLFARKPGRAAVGALVIAWVVVTFAVALPQFSASLLQRNIAKTGTDGGVLDSREKNWQESAEAADLGGWIGVGYGVSAGIVPEMRGMFSYTGNYGREKGNSQLAIAEETGLVGLALYGLLLVLLFRPMVRCIISSSGPRKATVSIIAGTLFGLLLQSIVEAWWVGPGSLEFCYFWLVAGVGLAASRDETLVGRSAIRRRVVRGLVVRA